MKYLLLAYGTESKFNELTKAEMAALGEKCRAYDEELHATGQVVSSGSLGWGSKSMRWNKGKLDITDGPYVEVKEVVGGFIIIEAKDFDDAVRVASLHPAARSMGEDLGWGIELRPMEYCAMAKEADAARA